MGKLTGILLFSLVVTMPHLSICATQSTAAQSTATQNAATQNSVTTTTTGSGATTTIKSTEKSSETSSAPITTTTTTAAPTTSMAPTTTTSTAAPTTTTEAPAVLGDDCSNRTDADDWCNATITGEAECGTDGRCGCASHHFNISNTVCILETDLIPIDLTTSAVTTNSSTVTWSQKNSVVNLTLSYTVKAKPAYMVTGLGEVSCTVETGQRKAVCTGLGSGYKYNVTVSTLYNTEHMEYFTMIQEITVPSTPGSLDTSASSFNASNVFLVWTPSQGRVDFYGIVVIQSDTPGTIKNQSTSDSHSQIYVTKLTAGTNYNVMITAYSYGKSSGERVGAFRTDSTVPGPPGQPVLVNTTMTSIKIRWTVTDHPNGDIKGHKVCIKYKSYNDQPYTDPECENITDANTLEYEKTDLFAGTYYQFDVYTVNDKYISSNSTLQHRTEASVPGKVSELKAIPNDTNIKVTWKRPSRPNGDIIAYQVQWTGVLDQQNCTMYQKSQENSTMETMPQCSYNMTQPDKIIENMEYIIRNLMPDTGYFIEVRAYTFIGPGEVSNITIFTNVSVPDSVTDVVVVVLNATTVNVTWTIPVSNPGPVTYKVTTNNMVDSSSANQSCSVQNYTSSSCVVPDLQEYWKYNFSVVASTDAGTSEPTLSNSIRTEEAAPGEISGYSFELFNRTEDCDATQVTIHWAEPELPERNSLIMQYIFYVDGAPKFTYNVTNPKPYSASNREFTKVFEDLEPEKSHTWKVRALSGQNTPGRETSFKITQGVCAPPDWPEEDIKLVEEITSTPSTVTIQLPDAFFQNSRQGSIAEKGLIVLPKDSKFYDGTSPINHAELEAWAAAHSSQFKKEYKVKISEDVTVQFMLGKDSECKTAETADNFCNGPLPEQFSFRLAAYVCTQRMGDLLCRVSRPFGLFATKAKESTTSGGSDGWVIALAVVMVLAAVIGAFVFLTYKGVIKPKTWLKLGQGDEEEQPFTPIDKIERNRPIPLSRYSSVLEDMHKDTNLQLSDQYDDINRIGQIICDSSTTNAAKLESNTPKNRWVNILPFDHSRVKLQQIDEDDPTTDYINANYIPGFYNKREYIATQGPLPGTIDDFWRMVWEHNVMVIVMLTQCKEGNRVKCEKYWPDELREPKQYGEVVVNPISISQLDKYNISIFEVSVNGQQSRQVIHFHYLDFPDFSANVEFDHFINFVKTVRGHVPHDMVGPMVIHCSAGVGRTGTFIATDRLNLYLNSPQFNENDNVDIFGIVVSMRENRVAMVQTESQFIMIHDCFEKMLEDKKRSLEMGDSDENLYANQGFEPFPEVLYENVPNSKQQTEL